MGVLGGGGTGGPAQAPTNVWAGGRSETLIGQLLAERPDVKLTVATKMGRRADPHVPDGRPADALRQWADRGGRHDLGVERRVQHHRPASPGDLDDRVFDDLDTLIEQDRHRRRCS